MKPGEERGGALVMTVLLLPVLLLSLALVVDAGLVLLARQRAQGAADMAALAACQELDLESLARGELVLDESRARAAASDYAISNLAASFPGMDLPREAVVVVQVHNPTPQAPERDRVTGRKIVHPTVCVVIEVRVPLRLMRVSGGGIWVRVHADASVAIP
ncbi:MAG TPA: pilus assembly protein TadG-related protein [Bacillota bacterium]|nr:pilus assembly protein TadG-related protein [Bacillota bacterium]